MSKLFKKYPQEILITLALVFSVLVLGYFIIGITSATNGIAGVFNVDKNQMGNTGLNLSAAAKLDLRGLGQ
jgi:hypothetical protein